MQSATHWQPSYSPDDRHKAVDAILIIWSELLLLTDLLIKIAQLMTDNRVVISQSLEAIIANFDIVVILIMWIAGLVRTINDVAIWYSEIDRQLMRWFSRLVYVPVYRGIG
jgi:hypothetical protein